MGVLSVEGGGEGYNLCDVSECVWYGILLLNIRRVGAVFYIPWCEPPQSNLQLDLANK